MAGVTILRQREARKNLQLNFHQRLLLREILPMHSMGFYHYYDHRTLTLQ
jgi:hypothetical protein